MSNNCHINTEKLKNKAKNENSRLISLNKAEEKLLKLKKEIDNLRKQVRLSKASLRGYYNIEGTIFSH